MLSMGEKPSQAYRSLWVTIPGMPTGETAIMALGVDDDPSAEALEQLPQIDGIIECGLFKDL